MALHRVGAWRLAGGKAVVNVPPMIGRDLDWIDADGLDRVDELEHALHLRPAVNAQQDVAARPHGRDRLAGFARTDCAQNVEAREHGAVLVRGPAHQREGRVGREREDAASAVEYLFADLAALYYRPWQFYNAMIIAQEYKVTHKLLFGTDYPFTTSADSIAGLRNVNHIVGNATLPRVPAQLIEDILARDAVNLLGVHT